MPKHQRRRPPVRPAELMAAYLDERRIELLDGVITAAALVAAADASVVPSERRRLLDFARRNGLSSVSTRAEILDGFDRGLRALEERRGADAALDRLARLAGRSPARLVIAAGREIAAADSRLDPREQQMLRTIEAVVGGQWPPSAAARAAA